jgi:4-hydroxy-tetrahydrodipicolinate synthase
MNSDDMHGIIVPVITPVDEEDQVDEVAYRALLRHLIKAGVQGLFVGGTKGEGPLLAFKEWERMAAIAFEECHGKTHLMSGTMDTSTRRIVGRVKALAQIEYKNFVVAPTFYITTKLSSEHLRLFGECKEYSEGMNMIAYNIPSCTGSMIQSEVMVEMVRRGWLSYCKDSSEDMDNCRRPQVMRNSYFCWFLENTGNTFGETWKRNIKQSLTSIPIWRDSGTGGRSSPRLGRQSPLSSDSSG